MKKASISVALQIAQILNDNDRKAISDAIGLLRSYGSGHELLRFLIETGAENPGKSIKAKGNVRLSAAGRSGFRELLLELKERNSNVHKRVLRFEEALIDGRLLPRAEEVKRLGQTVSKKFRPGKSRIEAVNSLILELLSLNDNEIVAVIEHVESGQAQPDSDGFQKLAHYLIGSKSG